MGETVIGDYVQIKVFLYGVSYVHIAYHTHTFFSRYIFCAPLHRDLSKGGFKNHHPRRAPTGGKRGFRTGYQ